MLPAEVSMSLQMNFESPPPVSLLRLALARKPGLKAQDELPRVEARLAARAADPARLSAYRQVCGFPDDGRLPLTFPFIQAAPLHAAIMAHADFPLPAVGLVHLRQTLWSTGPLLAGQPLELRSWVGQWRPARRGVEVDLHSEALVDGEPVWGGLTTVLSQKGPGHGEKRARPQPSPLEARRSAAIRVPRDTGARYAAVSGDHNPIHRWDLAARAFGFPRAIVHGMWSLARALAELDQDLAGQQVEAVFLKPVLLPSSLLFEAGPQGDALGFALRSSDGSRALLVGTLGPRA